MLNTIFTPRVLRSCCIEEEYMMSL